MRSLVVEAATLGALDRRVSTPPSVMDGVEGEGENNSKRIQQRQNNVGINQYHQRSARSQRLQQQQPQQQQHQPSLPQGRGGYHPGPSVPAVSNKAAYPPQQAPPPPPSSRQNVRVNRHYPPAAEGVHSPMAASVSSNPAVAGGVMMQPGQGAQEMDYRQAHQHQQHAYPLHQQAGGQPQHYSQTQQRHISAHPSQQGAPMQHYGMSQHRQNQNPQHQPPPHPQAAYPQHLHSHPHHHHQHQHHQAYAQAYQQQRMPGPPTAAQMPPHQAHNQISQHHQHAVQQQLPMPPQETQYGGAHPPPQQHVAPMAAEQTHHNASHARPYVQPTVGRLPADRPLVKLSVSLIDTYKRINRVYYEERDARRAARAAERLPGTHRSSGGGQGVNNHGWDDENYDYILTSGERFNERYILKERIGKGSFGQVVRALDTETKQDVAIKIIKSKKPFLMQAKTEIELLSHLCEKDTDDQNNIVRLLTHFMYRNHQCLVFEMLSLNLYELLKNTQFGGVSLNLIRKFAKQILKALSFLARPDVDIIHCDLKPENILLRHPKRSSVKVIDFGSSCKSNRRMYSYIQSRFYRSPEVMLGLPYSVAIDMWSLGCILVEMHTGEPLFSGSDQFDQMQKIVKILGMVPSDMLEQSSDQYRLQFFERMKDASGREEWMIKQSSGSNGEGSSRSSQKRPVIPSENPIASLAETVGAETSRRKPQSPDGGQSARNYEMFVDLIYRMLAYNPEDRIKPETALRHPFIVSGEPSTPSSQSRRDSTNAPMDDVADPRRYNPSSSNRGAPPQVSRREGGISENGQQPQQKAI